MSKKYKLIIIDDEILVIRGLKETVDWNALNIEIVAECNNGAKGLEAIHRLKPDLVITDIRMPVLDGIQLAKALAEEKFNCAVIIYSGYSDFEYVNKALEFGVTRYLLKPIENSALIGKINEVLLLLEQERAKRLALEQFKISLPLLKKNLIEQILQGKNIKDAEEKLSSVGIAIPLKGIVIISSVLQNTDKEFDMFFENIIDVLEGFGVIGQKYSEHFIVITKLTDTVVIYNHIKKIFNAEQSRSNCRFSVGISSPFGDSRTLQQAYLEDKKLSENVLFSSVNNINQSFENVSDNQRSSLINRAAEIIAESFAKKITIKDVAEKLFVSESHLMHEFKENLGETFNDCLTDFRVKKAKEMLSRGEYRIKEIADGVGYSDARYFGQVFKEKTGMTPSDYIKSIGKDYET